MNPILPTDLSAADLNERLLRMKDYRSWAMARKLDKMVISRPWLETQLKLSGYPEKLASVVFGKAERAEPLREPERPNTH